MINTKLLDAIKFLSVALAFAIASFFVLILWTSDLIDESYDPLVISVDYDCREVAVNSFDVPQHVIEECRKLIEKNTKTKKRHSTNNTTV